MIVIALIPQIRIYLINFYAVCSYWKKQKKEQFNYSCSQTTAQSLKAYKEAIKRKLTINLQMLRFLRSNYYCFTIQSQYKSKRWWYHKNLYFEMRCGMREFYHRCLSSDIKMRWSNSFIPHCISKYKFLYYHQLSLRLKIHSQRPAPSWPDIDISTGRALHRHPRGQGSNPRFTSFSLLLKQQYKNVMIKFIQIHSQN